MGSGFNVLGNPEGEFWYVSSEEVDATRPASPIEEIYMESLPQRLRVDRRKTAVVIIDMQNDFCSKGGWLDYIGVDVSPARRPISRLQKSLPLWREYELPIIWLNWGNREDRANLSPSLLHVYNADGHSPGIGDPIPGSGGAVLETGSWGASIVDGLCVKDGDICVEKYRMSGFWDTPLNSILQQLGIRTLLFAGVNADQCVLHTLADANFHGYDCVFLDDCCATTCPSYCWDATVFNVRQIFGFTVASTDLHFSNHGDFS